MAQLASDFHAEHAPPFGLATDESLDDSADTFPRWAKVLQVSQDLDAGRYDDEQFIADKLDACMDRLVDDLAVSG